MKKPTKKRRPRWTPAEDKLVDRAVREGWSHAATLQALRRRAASPRRTLASVAYRMNEKARRRAHDTLVRRGRATLRPEASAALSSRLDIPVRKRPALDHPQVVVLAVPVDVVEKLGGIEATAELLLFPLIPGWRAEVDLSHSALVEARGCLSHRAKLRGARVTHNIGGDRVSVIDWSDDVRVRVLTVELIPVRLYRD